MNKSISVLFVLESLEDVENILKEMEKWDFSVRHERVSTFEEISVELKASGWDLIISDFPISQYSSTAADPLNSVSDNEIPYIVYSKEDNFEKMLEAVEKFCSDYILKNDFNRLRLAVYRVLNETDVCKRHNKIMMEYFEENNRLLNILRSIGDGIIITDNKGNIIMINKVALEYTGFIEQEALGKPLATVFNIVDRYSRMLAENLFEKVLKEGKATGLRSNSVLISKDSKERFVSANCAPIVTVNKGIAGVILVFRDITRIRNNELVIINQEKNLNIIFDAAPAGMLLLNQDATIKRANRAIYNIVGKKLDTQAVGKKIEDFFICPNIDISMEGCHDCGRYKGCALNIAINDACSSERAIENLEIKHWILVNGKIKKIWLRISSEPIIIEAKRHTLVIVDDITGLKQLQEELKESNLELSNTLNELTLAQEHLIQQEKLAGIGQLAAGIAHEINNPLGFVMSNFETLKRYFRKYQEALNIYKGLKDELFQMSNISNFMELDGLNKEFLMQGSNNIGSKLGKINQLEQKANMNFIMDDLEDLFNDTNEGLERIGKIIMGLRLFSRVDQKNDIAEYDLNEGISNTLIVTHNEIKYYAVVKEDLQNIPLIQANGGQINQVLLNLIVNAVHAIREKNNIQLGLIRISTRSDDKFVYCSIEDNGNGIEDTYLKKIFDPFFTTKSIGKGTGLGLSISYDIITNKHGGELLVKSSVGIGSTFTIKLPINQ